jgi:hypothetical protein
VQHLHAVQAGATVEALTAQLAVPRELLFHLVARRAITFAGRPRMESNARLIHTDYLENKDALHLARWLGVSPWRPDA